MNLRQQTFSAIRWTTLAMVGRTGLSLLQLAILARLLTPGDFGLMALATSFLTVANIFADVGVSNALIHHQKISQEQLSSLYWLNIGAGGLLTISVMLASPMIASVYGNPALQPLLLWMSATFLIGAAGQQLRVMAEKDLRFAALARIELVATLSGFVVAVFWAVAWPGVYALVAGSLFASAVVTVQYWRYLADGWRPMLRLRLSEIRHFLSFGGYTMANNLVGSLNRQADIVIGGQLLSQSSLGVYSLSRDLSLRVADAINPVVTRVGLPVMARVQHDPLALKAVYLKTLRMTTSVNFPLYMAVAVFAPEVVTLLLGPQWADAAPLLRVLALWGLIRSTVNPVGSLLLASGRADLEFKWNLGLLFITLPLLWLGSHNGSLGLALALLTMALMLSIPAWYILVKPLCNAGFFEYYEQLAKPLLAALLAAAVACLSVTELDAALIRLSAGLITGGAAYLAASWWLNRPWLEAMLELLMRKGRQHG